MSDDLSPQPDAPWFCGFCQCPARNLADDGFSPSQDIDQVSRVAIERAGFEVCFSAVRGAVEPGRTKPLDVPRHHVEFHWPKHELMLWASGYLER